MADPELKPADAREGGYTQEEIRDLSAAINLHRDLVRVQEKVRTLEITSKRHGDDIDTLMAKSYSIPFLERGFAQVQKDLNELGGRHNREVHALEIKLEKGLNEMGRSIRQEISNVKDGIGKDITALKDGDILELINLAHTVRSAMTFLVALIAGGVLLQVAKHYWPH